MRPIHCITLAAAIAFVTWGAAAATLGKPPDPQDLAGVLHRLLDLVERGGPAVLGLEAVLALAFLGGLAAVVLVLLTVVQALPRVARPLADAVATIRGGPTQREEALRAENGRLRAEIDRLKVQVVGLEHRDEEQRRIVDALLAQLEAAAIDVAVVRAMVGPPELVGGADAHAA